MNPQFWSRWLRRSPWARRLLSSSHPQVKTPRKLPRKSLLLETLEDRTLFAVLPAPVVSNQVALGGSGIDAQVVIDPLNPSKLVASASSGSGVLIWYSTNAGSSWNGPSTIMDVGDPSTFNAPSGAESPFAQNEHANLAFDRLENFYVVSAQHNANDTSGAIVLDKWNFSGGAPSRVGSQQVIYSWFNQDPAYNPVVAVDSNLPSFTDNRTGIAETQTDTMANNLPQVTYSVENESLNTPGNNYNTGAPLTQATYQLNTVTIPSSFGLGSTGSGYTIGDYLTLATIQEASATPTYGGAGYLLGDTLEVATLQFASVPANNAVVAPGTGYAVGDILDVSGGTAAYPAQLIVTGVGAKGAITSVALYNPGEYAVLPTNPVATTATTGKGDNKATFNLIPQVMVGAASIAGAGTGYAVGDILELTGGTPPDLGGTPAQLTVTSVDSTGAITGVVVNQAGSYAALPTNPVSVTDLTTGTASGADFNISGGGVATPAEFTVTSTNLTTGAVTGVTINSLQSGAYSVQPVGSVYVVDLTTAAATGALLNLTSLGGTAVPAQVQVESVLSNGQGAITALEPVTFPGWYASPMPNSAEVTGGTGTGATFNVTFQNVVPGIPAQLQVGNTISGGSVISFTVTSTGQFPILPTTNPVYVATDGAGMAATFIFSYQENPVATYPKAVYVAWDTNFTEYTGAPNPTLCRIWVAASDDGGQHFSTPEFVSANASPGADPEIIFPQGSVDGRVTGGQLMFFWNASPWYISPTFNQIDMASSQPDGGVATQPAVAEQIFQSHQDTPIPISDGAKPPSGSNVNSIPVPTYSYIDVNLTDSNFEASLDDLEVDLNLVYPNLNQLAITLTNPQGLTLTLVDNRTDPITGKDDYKPQQGLPDGSANMGVLTDTIGNNIFYHPDDGQDPELPALGTVFDDNAERVISDPNAAAPYIDHFRPEGAFGDTASSLHALISGGVASVDGTWKLTIWEEIHTGTNPLPPQFLINWSLNFTGQISNKPSGFGSAKSIGGCLAGSPSDVYPTLTPASPLAGVGPGISVAVDNSLGSYSLYQGTIYVAYTTGTGIYLISSNDSGTTWNNAVQVNNDVLVDNMSESGRPVFMPDVAVDPVTGTVVVTWYDGRYDPSLVRMANYIATSIDGGNTFSPETFLNPPKQATDAITGEVDTIEPVPGNQPQAGALGFGNEQGLAVYDGHVYAAYTSNLNSGGTSIFLPTVTIAAGPRIIYGDMGPITAPFTGPLHDVSYNDQYAADGTEEFNGFVVQFDRPIDVNTLTPDQVTIVYRDTVTPTSLPGVTIPSTDYTVIPLDRGWGFGLLQPFSAAAEALATTFLIELDTPRSGVGTYSYAIGNATGPVGSVNVTNGGSGYTSAPTVTFNGSVGVGATATANLSTGVGGVTITSGGSGYTTPPTVFFAGGGGSGAKGIANLTPGVTSISVTNGGRAYSSVPAVVITGGGGTGATGTALLSGGVVISVTINNPGYGYTSVPTVTFTGGGGSGAAGIAIVTNIVASVTITNRGSGYTTPPSVSFAGYGTGAAGTVTLTNFVSSVTVTSPGSGYTAGTTVSFTGGGGPAPPAPPPSAIHLPKFAIGCLRSMGMAR